MWLKIHDDKPRDMERVLIWFNGEVTIGYYHATLNWFSAYSPDGPTATTSWWMRMPERPDLAGRKGGSK